MNTINVKVTGDIDVVIDCKVLHRVSPTCGEVTTNVKCSKSQWVVVVVVVTQHWPHSTHTLAPLVTRTGSRRPGLILLHHHLPAHIYTNISLASQTKLLYIAIGCNKHLMLKSYKCFK